MITGSKKRRPLHEGIVSADGSPLIQELLPAPDVKAVFQILSRRPHCLFLDSALRERELGRYSFLTADPFDYFELPADGSDALAELSRRLNRFHSPAVPDLPPFQGGAAGLFSYDLAHSLEQLPSVRHDEFDTPALAIGLYDVVIAFDHLQDRAWIISQGFPELETQRRRERARDRLEQFRAWITQPSSDGSLENQQYRVIARQELAPQFEVRQLDGLTSNFTPDGYRRAIRRAIEYIYAGDVFQVNLSQRLLHPAEDAPVDLYMRLRNCNPATFAAYFDLGEYQIISASPERFLSVHGREVEARPIKGTRQRSRLPEADLFAGDDLLQSEKDRAENIMIVDLLRNDISRVCRPETVHVTDLCRLEVYEYVQHLVSVVRGSLADELGPVDLIRAAFPGGSITGAPKVRAMEIIAELEPTARGAYCGSLGYVGFNGSMDLSILIRTITAGRGWWQLPVGGGIVAQSDPQSEFEETWHKAKGLIKALR